MSGLTHINNYGEVHMVDVGDKEGTQRIARAKAIIKMEPFTLKSILEGNLKKGEALAVARIAGIMAAKKTSSLIPLCHPLLLTKVELDIKADEKESLIKIESYVKTSGQTGVEMEALTAVTVAALTIYDMAKSLDKAMLIENICLLEKKGGKSGHFLKEF